MHDLISRRQAVDAVEKNACNTQRIMDAVNNLPSAQPDVIRCKDCKWHIRHDKRCGYWNHGVKPDMWCSQAERRTDE